MSKGIYIGNSSNVAAKVKKIYMGDNSEKARKVKKMYIGDSNHKARMIWTSQLSNFILSAGSGGRAITIDKGSIAPTYMSKQTGSFESDYYHRGIAYVGESFIIGGDGGKIYVSNDGQTFAESSFSMDATAVIKKIRCINSKLFACVDDTTLGTTNSYGFLRYKNNLTDTTWTQVSQVFDGAIIDVAYGGGYYIVLCGGNTYYPTICYSTDLATWNKRTTTGVGEEKFSDGHITYAFNLFHVTCTQKNTYHLFHKSDFYFSPTNFTITSSVYAFIKTKYVNGMLLGVGGTQLNIRISTNGINWSDFYVSSASSGTREYYSKVTDICYGGDFVWVATGYCNISTFNYERFIMISTDNMATWNIMYYPNSEMALSDYFENITYCVEGGTI